MKNKSIGTLIITILLIIFLVPWISFWIGYFFGWVTKITVGKYIVEGFALLGITIPLDKIPLIAGIINWLAAFFTSYKTNND